MMFFCVHNFFFFFSARSLNFLEDIFGAKSKTNDMFFQAIDVKLEK
jgi:hypothetical protein